MATEDFSWTPKTLAVDAATELESLALDELLRMYRDRLDGEQCDHRLRALFVRIRTLSRSIFSLLGEERPDMPELVERVTGLFE